MKKLIFLLTLISCFIFSSFVSYAIQPTVQAKYLAFSSVTTNSVTVHWTRGNGTNRIVVIRTDNNWAATDAILGDNGPTYTDNNGNLTGAPQVGTTGSRVIDVMGTPGTPDYLRQTNLTNLASGTTYYIKVYEFNVDGSNWDYNNSSDINNPRSFRTLTSFAGGLPGGFSVSPWSEGGRLSWTSDGSGAAGYYLSVWNNALSAWVFQNRDIGLPSDRNYQVFGLANNTSYTYYLWSYDIYGNVSGSSTSATATTLANPGIASATYTPGHGTSPYYNNVGIGCNIVVTVTATNNQLGLLPNGTQTINGINVTPTFTDNRDGTYTLTYTVASGHTDINDNGTNLPLAFNFRDGNFIPFASTYSPANNLIAPGVDQTRPTVSSINRLAPLGQCTNLNSVTFRVTFSEPVNTASVSTSDFTITGLSGSGSVGTISSVTPVSPVSGGTNQYDVTVDVTSINREIRLDFTGSVNDMAYGCPNASSATFSAGQTYFVDHTNPSASILIPTNATCYRAATLPPTISGTASDTWVGGAPCPISSVEVAIWLDVNGNGIFDGTDGYWTGSAWSGTSPTWFAATLSLPNWNIAMFSLPTDARYYLQTRVTDGAGNVVTSGQYAHYFIYDNTPPTSGSITNPTTSTCVRGGDVLTIQWNNATDLNLVNTVSIDYSTDGGSTWTPIISSHPISGGTGSYPWTVPVSVNTNNAQIRIRFSDCAGNTYHILSPPFIIDNTAPTISTSPSVGTTCLIAGNSYNITWAPSGISDPNFTNISLYYYDGTNLQLIASGLGNSGSYTWNIPSSTYVCANAGYIQLRAFDCAGNFSNASSVNFTIDNLAITSHPSNSQICTATGSTTFTVAASSNCSGSPSGYQWEYSASPGGPWSNVTNGTPTNATYSGNTSNTLTVTSNPPGIPTGTYYYRCVLTSSCGTTVTSNPAQLNVVPPFSFTTYPSNPTAGIIGSALNVTINFSGGSPATKSWALYRDDDGSGYDGTLVTSGSGTGPVTILVTSNVTCTTYGQYYIRVSDDCGNYNGSYFTIQALAAEPTIQASGISGGRTRTTISLIWTSGNGMGRLVAATGNSTSYTGQIPVDGSTYSGANSYWPSASWFTSSPTKLLYDGTGSSVYITGLTASTWYAFRIFEYNYNTSCPSTSHNYNTNTATDNPRAIRTTAKEVDDDEVLRAQNFSITSVWPNPVEDVLQFDLLIQKAANFKVEIIGMDGRSLFTHEYSYNNVATTVMIVMDKNVFAPGAYMLRVSALGETIQQPFIFMP